MAHKYDHRFTAGGCAYWRQCCTWYKTYSARITRRMINQALHLEDEDLLDKRITKARIKIEILSWDIYD